MKCLVTGAAGFIGSALAKRLVYDGHEVTAVAHWHTAVPTRLLPVIHDIDLRYTDLSNVMSVAGVARHRHFDWVFHLAATGVYPGQTNILEMVDANVKATGIVHHLSVMTGASALVAAGTSLEYGPVDHPTTENDTARPTSRYGMTKALATELLMTNGAESRTNVTVLRLYSVFGPGEADSRLMPTLIRYGREGKLPPLANPDAARDFTYVDDVVDAFILAARKAGGQTIYNIGTGEQTTLREVVLTAQAMLPINDTPQWGENVGRVWDTSVWVANAEKARRELDWTPKYDFVQGFAEMITVLEAEREKT